ncbi:hypothetical protein M430DRAFT_33312 [Amorphotheca resinae ATCC 22711]|uniref:Uncharacterized protein n=1 Tax=Amorphotheca resinae ATCC 22711 TaxID=857342 RepID=A0A2T3BBK6_AMORE|nr:hypothetical protein M430DRAFT_33312 [Amorphotheca resinae ATCC 22711]PSS25701.1 hypothetical protein M430DRAFT_33312 [Amorphotheca resinae ATCC 22711]
MKPPSSVDSDGQDAIAQGHQGTGSQSAKRPRPRYSSSRWGRPSPKGSLMGIIQEHLHLRLYVDPILWTPHHIELLNVSVMPSTLGPPHRPTCPRCSCCGRVITGILNLLRLYPYRTDHNLARLIRTTIDSFNLSSGPPLFRVCKHHKLPFYFGGKKQCWVLLPLLVRDISSGVPLVAFTHETERSAVFEARYPRRDVTIQARILAAVVSEINPHDVAILIAMAQDTQRAQPKPPGQGPAFFTPTLITPTPDREALYVYRATISSDYLESFADIHKPLVCGIRILRTTIPFNDPAVLLDTLGQILNIHQRLESARRSRLIRNKENPILKRSFDGEEISHPVKRQRHARSPLADMSAPNQSAG